MSGVVEKITLTAAWANILALLVGIASLRNQINEVSEVAKRTEEAVLGSQLHISHPLNGSHHKGVAVEIHGFSPFRDGWHYLVVTPQTGREYIQGGPLRVSASGLVSGWAQLGDANAGVGMAFVVRLFHTRVQLPEGAVEPPSDAQYSESISILREE